MLEADEGLVVRLSGRIPLKAEGTANGKAYLDRVGVNKNSRN